MKRIFSFFLLMLILTSCGQKETNDPKDLLRNFFDAEVNVTTVDGKLSFILQKDKIIVTKPSILEGSEFYFSNGTLNGKFIGYNIPLPESFSESIASLMKATEKIYSDNMDNIQMSDGKIIFEGITIEEMGEELRISTKQKEFILKRTKKENEKDRSNC